MNASLRLSGQARDLWATLQQGGELPVRREDLRCDAKTVEGIASDFRNEFDQLVLRDNSAEDQVPWKGTLQVVHPGGWNGFRPHQETAQYTGDHDTGHSVQIRYFSPQGSPFDPKAVNYAEMREVDLRPDCIREYQFLSNGREAFISLQQTDLAHPEKSFTQSLDFNEGWLVVK